MAFDEDAVVEAVNRIQPSLDAILARLDALEAGGGTGERLEVLSYLAAMSDGTTRNYLLDPQP